MRGRVGSDPEFPDPRRAKADGPCRVNERSLIIAQTLFLTLKKTLLFFEWIEYKTLGPWYWFLKQKTAANSEAQTVL